MSALLQLAISVGAPLVEKALADKFGRGGAKLARSVLEDIAERVGVPVGGLDDHAVSHPVTVGNALVRVEAEMPERIALYADETAARVAIFEQEAQEPLWARVWRPMGMYGLGVLWFWNVIILHVVNAMYKIALPQMPFADLLTLSGLYMSLYMGGHTVKAVADSFMARGRE